MNEAETRGEYIDPALKAAGWGVVEGSRFRREYSITRDRFAEVAFEDKGGSHPGRYYQDRRSLRLSFGFGITTPLRTLWQTSGVPKRSVTSSQGSKSISMSRRLQGRASRYPSSRAITPSGAS